MSHNFGWAVQLDTNDNLHIDPQHVRNLATGLTTIANTSVTSTFLPGETMLGVGKFISAFNAAVDSVTMRARIQCAYVDDAVAKTLDYVRLVEEHDAALGRALEHGDD